MNTEPSLPAPLVEELARRLAGAPPAPGRARPVHVVYGGAHLFKATTPAKLGERARSAMDAWAGDAATFGRTVGVSDASLAREVTERVLDKLARRPVEAMCIDFEDGYGPRSDREEDAEAVRAATELAQTNAPATAIGVRIKALAGATVARGLRTLDLFVTTLARSAGEIPSGFSVTLPKFTSPEQVSALADGA